MNIHKPLFIILYIVLFAVCHAAERPDAAERPNILLIVSDDQSYPHLGCYGEPFLKTPNIDRMAAEGMKFHRMFVTSPQCAPSRGSLMTGRSPVAIRMSRFGSPLPKDEITFPEILRRDAGYFTGILGRVHHIDGTPHGAFMQAVVREHPHMATLKSRMDFVDSSNQTHIPARMKDFFDQRPGDKPYFLQVNLNDPHLPWTTRAGEPPDPKKVRVPEYLPDLPEVRRDLSRYFGECEHADLLVKNILDKVKARAGLSNTLIIYTSDNGYAFPRGKGSLHDSGIHVPLVAHWEGVIAPGTESSALISGEDFAPTFLDVAGIEVPAHMTGVSFLPLLRGEAFPNERKAIFATRAPHTVTPYEQNDRSLEVDYSRCIREARFKLIMNVTPERLYETAHQFDHYTKHWPKMREMNQQGTLPEPFKSIYFGARPGFEFYDLEADPDELNNLYGQEQFASDIARLKRALRGKMYTDHDYLPLP